MHKHSACTSYWSGYCVYIHITGGERPAGLWEHLQQDNKFVVFPSFWDEDNLTHVAQTQPMNSTMWVSPAHSQNPDP